MLWWRYDSVARRRPSNYGPGVIRIGYPLSATHCYIPFIMWTIFISHGGCNILSSMPSVVFDIASSGPSRQNGGDFIHDDVIKWKQFLRYLPFERGIHRSPVNSPHKGQWRGALMFSLICAWTNGWVNNGEAGDLRRHRAHYDVIVMLMDGVCTPPAIPL